MKSPSVQRVLDALTGIENRFTQERHLQRAIGQALEARGYVVEREKVLTPKDRIDFDVFPCGPKDNPFETESVGIEIKVKGGVMEHLRQLYRYAPHFKDLLLITTQASAPEPMEMVVRAIDPKPGESLFHNCQLHVLKLNFRFQ